MEDIRIIAKSKLCSVLCELGFDKDENKKEDDEENDKKNDKEKDDEDNKKDDKEKKEEYFARNIEKGIYNFTIHKSKERRQQCSWENDLFKEIYMSKLRQICGNLSTKSYIDNKDILERLWNDEFKPHEIAFMTCYELSPEHWKKTLVDKEKRDSMMCEIDFGQATTQFWCMRCKKNQTTYYTMQTRSADEAETIFITCLNCGKRWRK